MQVVDRRRHAPIGRSRVPLPASRAGGQPSVYRGRGRKAMRNVYDSDHAVQHHEGRFRWLLSTVIAATIGATAIVMAIWGSMDPEETREGLIPTMRAARDNLRPTAALSVPQQQGGLPWTVPKTDRMNIAKGAASTRFIIHETIKQRRVGREYIQNKPFARVMARLAPVPPTHTDRIPAFNPYKLYATSTQTEEAGPREGRSGAGEVDLRYVELIGGLMPAEDGQQLSAEEIAAIITELEDAEDEPAVMRPGFRPEGADLLAQAQAREPEPLPPNTTALQKTTRESDESLGDLEVEEVRVVKAARGDTLSRVLAKQGTDIYLAREMVQSARGLFQDTALQAGQEVHLTMVPSLTQAGKLEPARISVFADGHEHKVTVTRNAAGEFVASATPVVGGRARAALEDDEPPQASSLYASIYSAGLAQSLQDETIQLILRIHAYETDYRRRLRAGDMVEFFFDMPDETSPEGPPGDLLYTALVTGGETSRYYRFRTPDGEIDYYDEFGNNSRKFLMRRPVRGEGVRLTSGFGIRHHPLLNERRMHTGVDWAGPVGTPILAAGAGSIEEAGRKGWNGNYVRIRHANGYQTTYSHMKAFAPGIRDGIKVRQGQLIGYIGSTGLSTGPHLHYEVLVNARYVDPLQIQVPRERRLTGKMLADFQRERGHVDDLRRRAPVMTTTR